MNNKNQRFVDKADEIMDTIKNLMETARHFDPVKHEDPHYKPVFDLAERLLADLKGDPTRLVDWVILADDCKNVYSADGRYSAMRQVDVCGVFWSFVVDNEDEFKLVKGEISDEQVLTFLQTGIVPTPKKEV